MPIAKKLAAIMGEVSRVEKNGRNDFHKYDYVTEADLVEAIRGSMSAHGVAFLPSVVSTSREGDITSAEMEFKFVDGEDGTEFTTKFWGYGQDKGDKGAYKAYTGAVKYALMKTFLVPTGDADDPEHDGKTPPKPNRNLASQQTKGGGAQGQTQQKPAEPLAESFVNLLITEFFHRDSAKAWPVTEAILKPHGVPTLTRAMPLEEKKAALKQALYALNVTEANDLLVKLRELPKAPTQTQTQQGG